VAAFVGLVVLPVAIAACYLWAVAVDQYASRLAFTVRQDTAAPAAGLIGGMAAITALSGRGGQEADVIAAFVTSPDLVARIDSKLDLRAAFSVAHARDPVFALAPGAAIEDLTRHWRRQVDLAYDPGTGLIDLTVRAFDPVTAQAVARAILDESAALADRLSRGARDEAMVHAAADLARAENRLASARMAMARFRAENRLVDPAGEAAVQSGLVASLEAQLAEALIAQDMLAGTTRLDDPRVVQAARRIAVIEGRIMAERARFAPDAGGAVPTVAGAAQGRDHASVMADHERLAVDQAFAEAAYTAALAAVEAARADAARRAMHLAPHVEPTLAERAEYPRRWIILGLVIGGATLIWSVLALATAALRDRA
jgi:capsular polysaccharide transport system permease protein